MVTTLAGNGPPLFHHSEHPTQAAFSDPFGIAIAKDGTIYISDAGESNRIRKITREGKLTTLAGGSEGFANGQGSAPSFNIPSGLALDSNGNRNVADTGNNLICKMVGKEKYRP